MFVRVLLAFPLPILLGNGVREVLKDARVQPSTQAGWQAAVSLIGIVLGIWLGFVLARRYERRALAAGPRIGTRAWEADQTAQLIERAIADRRRELASATGERRARLEVELAALEPQLAEQRRIAASGDASPGRGRIGFDLPA